MPQKPLSEELMRQAVELVEKHGGVSAASKASGIKLNTLKGRLAAAKRRMGLEPVKSTQQHYRMSQTEDQVTIESLSSKVRTVEDALKKGEVDTDVWEVDRFVLNGWEVGAKLDDGTIVVEPLWQVKLWLKRRDPIDPISIGNAMIDIMREYAPKYPKVKRSRGKKSYMLEISVPDLHLGKLAWAQETGEDYDTEIATNLYDIVVEDFIIKTDPYDIDRILIPVGNDLLHVDNSNNTTTAGTPQDVDGRWQRAFVKGYELLIRSIDKLVYIAPVDVLVVPGNHDRERTFYLGCVLEAWYHNSMEVTVDNSPELRKYVKYGNSLLGFTHGSEEKHDYLESIMIRERPQDFTDTTHREWHLGHFHKKRETKYIAGDTHGGTQVKILPSLSGTDAWHYSKGWVHGVRAAEAYLWHKEDGYTGHLSSNAGRDLYVRK